MAVCAACSERSPLPYTCSYCGERHCVAHRLPGNHDCTRVEDIEQIRKLVDSNAVDEGRDTPIIGTEPNPRDDASESERSTAGVGGLTTLDGAERLTDLERPAATDRPAATIGDGAAANADSGGSTADGSVDVDVPNRPEHPLRRALWRSQVATQAVGILLLLSGMYLFGRASATELDLVGLFVLFLGFVVCVVSNPPGASSERRIGGIERTREC